MTKPADSITIPDAATGSEHALVTVDGKVYPVAMLSDSSGHYKHDVYIVSALAMAKSASKNYLSLYNADATLKVEIIRAIVCQEVTAAVTGLVRGYRLFRFTTVHSAGSSPTIRKTDTALAAVDADITARSNGQTVGGVEAEALGIASTYEEETGGGEGRYVLFDEVEESVPIRLNTNEGVVIQQDATGGTGVLSAKFTFRVK